MGFLGEERIGEINKNNFGSLMEIIEYRSNKDIVVRFNETNNTVKTFYHDFRRGKVRNPYDRSLYGVGYNGVGKYKASENGKDTFIYMFWKDMMKRCYSEKFHEKRPSYKDCSVSSKWHNLQDFGAWFDNNYYKVDDETMSLDKDILVKGNKVYSPDTCVFAPRRINSLFVKNDANRGDYPIGVTFNEKDNIYLAKFKGGNRKNVHIGSYKTAEDAFYAYKKKKENYIKQMADYYKDKIPDILYKAMYSYEISITD
ncbi:AP2 domain-containing protein [Priestia aryabhattai]|uniref:AP2 domain-containing protein n=1 Tax=Priestia aryabhattai TaxID=412384 RepID=UPI0015F6F701|nr:AP2 domain-containing protein [Priestia aryabhattai]